MRNPIEIVRSLYHDVVAELKKCTWPTRNELTESTVVVIVSVLMLSAFVALVDWLSRIVIHFVTVQL